MVVPVPAGQAVFPHNAVIVAAGNLVIERENITTPCLDYLDSVLVIRSGERSDGQNASW